MLGSASKIRVAYQPAATAGAAVPRCLIFQRQVGQRKCARIGRLSQVSHLSHLI